MYIYIYLIDNDRYTDHLIRSVLLHIFAHISPSHYTSTNQKALECHDTGHFLSKRLPLLFSSLILVRGISLWWTGISLKI